MEPTMTNPKMNPRPIVKLKTTAGPLVLLLLLLLSVTGCFSLSRGAPGQTHYVLGGGDSAEVVSSEPLEADSGAVTTPVIGLRPPELAAYLANAYIVVRRGVHMVGFSEFDRWGEDLSRGITRTLAGHLAARVPDHRVEAAPWSVSVRPDRLIEVHILRFEGTAPEDSLATEGEAHLQASWEILDPGGARLATGTTDVRSDWTVGDFGELVGLLDAALDVLAEDLVEALERVRAPPEARDPP